MTGIIEQMKKLRNHNNEQVQKIQEYAEIAKIEERGAPSLVDKL